MIKNILFLSFCLVELSCSNNQPQPIKLNTDKCHFCEMTISDGHFGAEILTQKGRVYKFDDLQCMLRYSTENKQIAIQNMFVNDFTGGNLLINTKTAFYLKHETFKSPMRGNIAAFKNKEMAANKAAMLNINVQLWEDLIETK